jgi:hypothetical protein
MSILEDLKALASVHELEAKLETTKSDVEAALSRLGSAIRVDAKYLWYHDGIAKLVHIVDGEIKVEELKVLKEEVE